MKQNNYNSQNTKTGFTVNEPAELMTFLQAKMGGMSRNSIKSLLAHRQISVNNKIITQYNYLLQTKDRVEISKQGAISELVHPKLKILYEDDFLIIIEKKEGLLTVSTGKADETTAFSILKNYVKKISTQNRIFVVHRLDRETSGVLVFAKSRDIQLALQENWHNVVTQRTYVALVEGKTEKAKDTIVTWLTENPKSLKIHSSTVDDGGQRAVTHYNTVKNNENFSLLEVNLETGRKNQIRVHLQQIGHPIVGDKKYGSQSSPIGRVGLHARILAFIHPATRKELRIETPVPRNFLAIFH